MKNLTASDRKSLIRLASSLPAGDKSRRAILAGLNKVAGRGKASDDFKQNLVEQHLDLASMQGSREQQKAMKSDKALLSEMRRMSQKEAIKHVAEEHHRFLQMDPESSGYTLRETLDMMDEAASHHPEYQ